MRRGSFLFSFAVSEALVGAFISKTKFLFAFLDGVHGRQIVDHDRSKSTRGKLLQESERRLGGRVGPDVWSDHFGDCRWQMNLFRRRSSHRSKTRSLCRGCVLGP